MLFSINVSGLKPKSTIKASHNIYNDDDMNKISKLNKYNFEYINVD